MVKSLKNTIGPGLIIANHRSYLDVLFIPTNKFFTIVGKVEIRSWPLIGWAGRALGVIWVKRESKSSRSQTKQTITEAVKRGNTVVLFPEGTSSEGPLLMPVHQVCFMRLLDMVLNYINGVYTLIMQKPVTLQEYPLENTSGKHVN